MPAIDEPFDLDAECDGPPDEVLCPLCGEWHGLADGYVHAECAWAAVKNAEWEHEPAQRSAR